MVGSERIPMEASLFGALVITNLCNVGSRFADSPFPSRLAGSPEANITLCIEELVTAIVNSLQNFEDLLADYAPARLYYSSLGAESMTDEARVLFSSTRLLLSNATA
jgi:hypothetical protein